MKHDNKENVVEVQEEHILVCLSSSPSNEKIIRTAAKMAAAFGCQFTALFVETPDFEVAVIEDKKRLKDNQQLAESLGATIEIIFGEDVPYQIAEFARLSKVSKIVLGRSAISKRSFLRKPTLTEQLIAYAPEMDIHIIPDKNAKVVYRPKKIKENFYTDILKNSAISIGILMGATFLSLMFERVGFTNANIMMMYILGVLLVSIATSHLAYGLVSSIASVYIFNYLFTPPKFSLAAYETGYPLTFVVMFITAFITSTSAIRYKEQAGQAAKVAYRTKIMFDANQLISKAKTREEILNRTKEQIVKLIGKEPVFFDTNDMKKAEEEIEEEGYLYLDIHVNDRAYGKVCIDVKEEPLDAFEHSVLLSILGECAMALENEKNAREKEETAVLAEREQLRADLLRAISHDLRTPLTSISGNAANLMNNEKSFDADTKKQLFSDIYDDSLWLINLVENLLSATRIEDGHMMLRISTELLADIVEEAMKHINRSADQHKVCVQLENDLMLVKADARLIVQVIINIVDNALKYTEAGSEVNIVAKKKSEMVEVLISDNGRGIPESEKDKVFDKFYCGERKITDNRRSLGLGLYLCKIIVEAHGGSIYVTDNEPQGSVFGFTLPAGEVILYE